MMLTFEQIILCCVLLLGAAVVFPLVRDPLRDIPGPAFARITGLWLIWIDISGYRSRTIHELHKKHGNVVRIGPREVSFSSQQAMRDIYGAGNKFIKAPAYEAFGRQSSFTIRGKEEHRSRQKRIAHVFAPATIASVEPLVHAQVQKLLKVLSKRTREPVDIMQWFRIFALDVVGSVFLGNSFGGLDAEQEPLILHDLDEVFPSLWVEWQFSTVRPLLLSIPYSPLRRFLNIGSQFYDYGSKAFKEYIQRHGRTNDRRDLLYKLLAGNEDVAPLEDSEIINEMTNLIFAGTDTTSNTFSYLFYELANLPEWQEKLHKELDSASFEEVPLYEDVVGLPVLDALLHETLRVHPAAPASLPRLAPAQGCVTVDGVPIPAKAIVSCQAYTMQRDGTVYPDPDNFDPGRWLNASEDHLSLMHDHIFVWGKGQRSCLGKRLAYMELKVGTAAVIKKFQVEIGSAATHDDMEMTDHFTLIAKGKKCVLRLQDRQMGAMAAK